MERRTLIAIAISFLILVLYDRLVLEQYRPLEEEGAPEQVVRDTPVEPPAGVPGGAPVPEEPPAPLAPPSGAPAAAPAAAEPAALPDGRRVVIETDLYRAVFNTRGARLEELALRDYRTSVRENSPPLVLFDDLATASAPLGLFLRHPERTVGDASVLYEVDRESLTLSGEQSGEIVFRATVGGAAVRKRIRAHGSRYLLSVQIDAEGARNRFSEIAIGWNRPVPPQTNGREVLFESVVALTGDGLETRSFSDIETGEVLGPPVTWAGFSGKYFLAALVADQAVSASDARPRLWLTRRDNRIETQMLLPAGVFGTELTIYLGPKSIPILEEAGHSLRRAVDLGFFSFIALPLLQALRWSHWLTGNYGVDIILLTVLIKVLFFPLTQKSMRSMQALQKLQPQMQKIREELKDKPEEMNRQVMELYKRHKVNPLGGCLPLLLQMPVFLGLYQTLLNAVELRHAEFALWINDLSAPDRLGSVQIPFVEPAGIPVLTLLMGGSMLAQQWMTPTTGDPTQQRMMMIMPVVFTFMFISFPSGLTLYWLVNNILTIGQQYVMNRQRES